MEKGEEVDMNSDVTRSPESTVQDNLRALSVVSALTSISFTSYVAPTPQHCLAANFNLDPRSREGRRSGTILMALLPLLPVLFLSAFLLYNISVNAGAVALVTKHRQALPPFQDVVRLIGALQYERHATLLLAATQSQENTTYNYNEMLMDSYRLTNNTVMSLAGQWSQLNLSVLRSSAAAYLSQVLQVRQQDDVMQAEQFYTDSVEMLIMTANSLPLCSDNNNNAAVDDDEDAIGRPTVTVQCYRLPLAMHLQENFTQSIARLLDLTLTNSSAHTNSSLSFLSDVAMLLSTSRALIDEYPDTCNITDYDVITALAQTYLATNGTLTSSLTLLSTLHDLYSKTTREVSEQVYGELTSTYDEACGSALSYLRASLGVDVMLFVLHLPLLLFGLKNASLITRNVYKLASLFSQRTTELQDEKKRTELLLTQMLPKSVYRDLQQGVGPIAEEFSEVTVMFSDIAQFNEIVFASSPLNVVNLLNTVYNLIDDILENHDVYKVETVGSTYMMVSGVPKRSHLRHAAEIANLALDILNKTLDFPIPHLPDRRLLLRLGAHSGPCVTAVVGNKLPRYCLFGDTVNTASRMQSNGLPCRIQISTATKTCLDNFGCYDTEYRSQVEIKGKGVMDCYWLLSRTDSPPSKSKHLTVPTMR